MTITQGPSRGTPAPTPRKRRDVRTDAARPLWRRPVAIIIAAVALAGAVSGAVLFYLHATKDPYAPTPAEAAVSGQLPHTVNGLKPAPAGQDFGLRPQWVAKARAAADGATIIGRTYGSPAQRRTVRVVVARTDLTGKLELTWAADAGHAVGDAHCTQNFKLTPNSPASIRPTMLMCWRTSPTLSAYSITIDFDHKPKDSDGVAALEDAWNSAA